jgi:hypothetical protein
MQNVLSSVQRVAAIPEIEDGRILARNQQILPSEIEVRAFDLAPAPAVTAPRVVPIICPREHPRLP